MGQFEDNLWGSVVDRHGDDLARAEAPGTTRQRRTRPRLLTGLGVGVAASATAVTLLLTATSSPPAFAVTRHHDGSVSVSISRRSGIVGANRTLAAMGVHGRVLAVSDGQALPLSCLQNEQTGGVADVIFPSAAAQQAQIVDGTYVPPANAGNTGGVPQNGPWHVVACASTGSGNTGNTGSGNTGNTGSGNTGNTGNTGAVRTTQYGNTGAG